MKLSYFLIFFSIVLLIYGLGNYYVGLRGYQALENHPSLRPWFLTIFIILASTYIAGRFMERIYISVFSDVLTWVGSFWLAILLYFFLSVLVIDLLRFSNYLFHWFPEIIKGNYPQVKFIVFQALSIFIMLIILAGHINARYPGIKKLDITIEKKAGKYKSLTIALATDIHMGTVIGKNRVKNLVKLINSTHPDIILLGGDVVDEDLAPVIRQDLGKELDHLKAPLGVWAITGNHEYIGGAEPAVKYLSQHGIRELRDEMVMIDSSFYLAGREDRDRKRFTGNNRKEIAAILRDADRSYPVILLDHQPFNLEKAVEAGVDLQLSGHTHDGQMWPFNYITDKVYEVGYGYLKKENSHFYVSNGSGSWGPPIRIGNRPEIVVVNITFSPPQN